MLFADSMLNDSVSVKVKDSHFGCCCYYVMQIHFTCTTHRVGWNTINFISCCNPFKEEWLITIFSGYKTENSRIKSQVDGPLKFQL